MPIDPVGTDGHGLDRLPVARAEVEGLVDHLKSDCLFEGVRRCRSAWGRCADAGGFYTCTSPSREWVRICLGRGPSAQLEQALRAVAEGVVMVSR